MKHENMDGACDWVALATQGVQVLSPYVPGKPIEELERELGLKSIIKLASNENPLGPSPKVLSAIQEAALDLHRYPDGSGFQLKAALANQFLVDSSNITLGNGSNEILELLVRAFVNPKEQIMYSAHAFAVYSLVAQAAGAIAQEISAKSWAHDLEAMLAAINDQTRIIFIANPNNPTGTWIKNRDLEAFLKQVPKHIIVVIDEAYAEYMTDPEYPLAEKWLPKYPNLVVTRTFSKAYGLAALRVGYSLSSPVIADILNRVRQPFNVNHLAQAAALAALADEVYLNQSCELNTVGLRQITQGLEALSLNYIPTQANFICFDLSRPAGLTHQNLLKRGVIVRPVANYGMLNWLRVSVGTQEENGFFLKALAAVLTDA